MRTNCDRQHRGPRAPARLAIWWAVVVALVAGGLATAAISHIDARAYLEHVKYLASDDLEGRANGSPGLEKAADYIAARFRAAGLQPGGDRGTFFQTFEIVTGLKVEPGNVLTLHGPRGTASFRIGRDYELLSVSSTDGSTTDGPVPVVFAGYGISAAPQHYDDYAGIDVNGRAVLIFTHEPQEYDASSPFEGRTNTVHSGVVQKAMLARSHGARAVLLVEDPTHDVRGVRYEQWMREPQADEYGIPVFHVSRDRVQQALGSSLDLAAIARDIDRDLKPRSRLLAAVSVRAVERVSKIRRPVRNVIGVLTGHDPARAGEAVVIGAHYDHLGRSVRHSLSPETAAGQIHHGADDNASGTAAVIEMAGAAAANRAAFPRTVIFATFAGEELGLLGSAYYVNHPTVPLESTLAMINLDMVGRAAGRILVSGLDSTPSLDQDLKLAQAGIGLQLNSFSGSAGIGDSDDTSFSLRKVPVVGFFSGFHADYHRPSDTWEKIDAAGGAAVADLALGLASRIASRSDRPEYIAPPPQDRQGGPSSGGVELVNQP
jgi:hypothetical protein